ncbi:aspartyl protease family protein [Patiriisocius hiemis]|uniref:Aspartyl protease family protein n=1 Tax=Patiriisocius hiemis TaxID=3075604 RepID=A0ABU2YAU1_9FLAO|nr:aspartyl protease family protein [Constantimarinum sp. W242]MDT0555306.1 aspartyl protease family protein [Constantimarinum sp. W242]
MQLRSFLEDKQFKRIPLKKLATGHYKFIAKVNGVNGEFILDTGASTSCIGLDYMLHFNLASQASDIKAAGAGATGMETQSTENNSFKIPLIKSLKMDFILFDLSHVNLALEQVEEAPVHGIIGADFLKKYRAVIDYGRNCFYISL